MAEGTLKSKLVALLKMGAEEQRAFIAGLSASQYAQIGTSEKWSAKDNLAYIAVWQSYRVQAYQMVERGETPPKLPGDNEQNETVFQTQRDQPWPEVIAATESAYVGLLALLEGYSDADLMTSHRRPPPHNTVLWKDFLYTGYTHPVFHYADFYLEHGDMVRASALQQRLANGIASLGNDESRGLADYNLACFYAKTGQMDLALALLPGALKLTPGLVEWSKGDPDLASLHGEPAYQALYAAT